MQLRQAAATARKHLVDLASRKLDGGLWNLKARAAV